FNAVEAEVYAMSSFFTAIVVWLMFKWEERADQPGNERWIILIAYLMGLSIGVHLLNLLTIPALAFIYYFRKYDFSWGGFIATGIVAVVILGVIQAGIIQYLFDIAWGFERFFTGTQYPNGVEKSGLGLPPGVGVVVFFTLLFGAVIFSIYYTHQKRMLVANTALMGLTVIFIGFSSYLMIPIRSNANPAIDENNPENAQTFLSYMKREQYGNRPLLYGPLYNALPSGLESAGKEYVLYPGEDRYTEIGEKRTYVYRPADQKLFPRMYEKSRYNSGPHAYTRYVENTGQPDDPNDDKPTAMEDLKFFWGYQVIHMYWRYFMWNFAGREGDTQDLGWESGWNFAHNSAMPDFMKNDPAKNHYFLLPFLLGLLGLGWQAYRKGYDATVVGLLFFFTGLAIIIYLNQYPAQPRERDYSFAGSFQTYAIWVGLGVIALFQLLERFLKGNAAFVAAALGLITVGIMGVENWDDHSRHGRYVAPDSAYNLLNSLAPNAVLFTNGDNDTFPLWYIQEVEGVRTDVRVLCLSYVNTDWYIDQMKQQVNQSPPLPITLSSYVGQENQSRAFGSKTQLPIRLPVDKENLLAQGIITPEQADYVVNTMSWMVPTRGPRGNKYLELKDMLILNLLENVAKEGWERPIYYANTVTPSSFIGLEPFLRQEGLAYRILPAKGPALEDPYDPFEGWLDLARMDSNMTRTFRYRNLDNPDVYYDENIRRMLANYHNTFYRLASGYLSKADRLQGELTRLKSEAEEGLTTGDQQEEFMGMEQEIARLRNRAKEVMAFTEEKFPYTAVTPDPYMLVRSGMMFDQLGQPEKAMEYFSFVQERALGTLKYYSDIGEEYPKVREYYFPLQMIQRYYSQNGHAEELAELVQGLQSLDQRMLQFR
ncbi:MAG: DUF2723 domain-containing protein, partial [Bacteroidetes bacterium]